MGDVNQIQWQSLSGTERLEVIERVREGRVSQAELCRTFGMSRQMLNRAMRMAEQAAAEALEPKRPGRKKEPASTSEVKALQKALAEKERELSRMQQKYEVAQTLLHLERKLDRGEALPGEGKKRRTRR